MMNSLDEQFIASKLRSKHFAPGQPYSEAAAASWTIGPFVSSSTVHRREAAEILE